MFCFQVKDYKHLRLEDLTVKPESSEEDDHSDGGYSDYINDGLSGEEGEYSEGKGMRLMFAHSHFPCVLLSFCELSTFCAQKLLTVIQLPLRSVCD